MLNDLIGHSQENIARIEKLTSYIANLEQLLKELQTLDTHYQAIIASERERARNRSTPKTTPRPPKTRTNSLMHLVDDYAKETIRPFTADDVVSHVGGRVDKATVISYLSRLYQQGKLNRIKSGVYIRNP